MGRFAGFLTLVIVGSCWSGPQCAEAVILINEVLADPSALFGDANGDGVIHTTQDEFVELVNTATSPVSLAGWTLSDLVQVRHVFAPSSSIPGLGFFVVFGGGAPQGFANVAVASTKTLALNNTGDTVTLRDAQALLVDAFTYGVEGGMDVSLTRSPDATGFFVQHTSVNHQRYSPGTTIDGLATLPIADDPPVTPEPSALSLFGLSLVGFSFLRRPRS